ncbi:MAG: PKD domain-containing protein [Chitinophagaceae bacterium]|nr:PKD domain-containing protein [Chitinophagaceae bacterium]MCW5925519.1 PKD domain-containing protein [Chitinophagaceae bacterium]
MKKGIFLCLLFFFVAMQSIAQAPVAQFSANVLSGCAPLSVRFTDESTGNPASWNWEFSDGTTQQLSNQQNPNVSLTRPGVYSVTLVVRNVNGVNAVTRTDYITVFPSPTVNFSADITTACLPAQVQFTGVATTSVGTITSWAWDFGDGNLSAAQNPSHTYQQAGWYNVALSVTSSTGCSARRSVARYVRVVSGIETKFSYTPSANCEAPFTVPFTNESSGPGTLSYMWDFGNGNTDTARHPTAVFAASGTHNVRLTTTSSFGCANTATQPVAVNAFNTAFTHPDTVCIDQPVSFQNTSDAGVVTFNWQFGDGSSSATDQHPVKRYTAAGVYNVKLINRFANCTDSVTRQIVVVSRPGVDFTAVNNFGCNAAYSVDFQSNAATAVSWLWNFGDGNTATEENPTHTYTGTGNYTVSLTITTAGGCQNTITKNNIVRIVAPTLNISSSRTQGCAPLNNVNFTATGNVTGSITSYLWSFGDGGTSTAANPTHNYTVAGVFNASLTVVTDGGCSLTRNMVIRAGTAPAGVDFTAVGSGACTSDPVQFTATSASPVTEWMWVFSDGETAVSAVPDYEHRFTDFGPVGATLVAIHNGCASAPVSKTNLLTLDGPVANFGFALDCGNRLIVTLTDSSITNPLVTTSYEWNFGDGQTSGSPSPGTHTYATTGNYNIRLTVTSGSCASTVVRNVDLSPLDNSFTVSRSIVCKYEELTFTAAEDSVNVRDFRWSLNGAPLFNGGKVVDTAFHADGDIPVTLVVRDRSGCEAQSTQTIKVTGPSAAFSPAVLAECKNNVVTFNDASVTDVGIASWTWNFGDGQTQTLNSGPFTHQYADTGTYIIQLSVTDIAGCVDENVAVSTIRISGPVASFSADATRFCPGTPLSFINTSQGSNLNYNWSFGDNQSSTDRDPGHSYAEGLYTVKLVVTDDVGCADSLTRTNYINIAGPVAAFDVQDSTSICPLLEAKFLHTSQNYESLYWDFGDLFNSTEDAGVVRHFYDNYGSYNVKLFALGYGGNCVDSAEFLVNVYNPSSFTSFDYSVDPYYCNEHTVSFQFDVPSNTRYRFNFGDGAVDSSGQKTLVHHYDYPRTYRPSVFLQDAIGCQSTVNGPHLIDIRGAVPAFNLDRKNFCDSGTVLLTNYTVSSEPVTSWTWDFGTGPFTGSRDPDPYSYGDPGLYPVTLTATTQSGCMQTYADTVRIPRTPEPLIIADDLTCAQRLIGLNGILQYPDTAITWSWNFGDGRSSASQNNSLNFPNPGTYNISLSAANFLGCSRNTSHMLTVAPLPVITAQATELVVSNEVVLPVTYSSGIATYQWEPPKGLSCTDCPNPIANPKYTQIYTVTVTDSNSCVSTADITVSVVCTNENYFVPNTFSPNGDGMNDVFYPRGRGLARVQSMRIFNRWGQQVFEKKNFIANDPSAGWDGRMNGQPLPSDAYVYVIEFICDNAQIVPFKGNITLIR